MYLQSKRHIKTKGIYKVKGIQKQKKYLQSNRYAKIKGIQKLKEYKNIRNTKIKCTQHKWYTGIKGIQNKILFLRFYILCI